MHNIFIKDGNFKEWVRILFVIIGIFFVVIGVSLKLSNFFGLLLFLIGIVVAAIGGYSAQAHMLKIKPFDNEYESAKETYKPDKQINESAD
jgi:hypothetical protein